MYKMRWLAAVVLALLAASVLPAAGGECKTCKGGGDEDWASSALAFIAGNTTEEPQSTLNTAQRARLENEGFQGMEGGVVGGVEGGVAAASVPASAPAVAQAQQPAAAAPVTPATSQAAPAAAGLGMIASFAEVSSFDVILDISPEASEYIEGAVHINYEDFLDEDDRLKSVPELARLLGNAGISRENSVLIYGECEPCGGGPSASTYAYWVMKYLGHDNVRLLDGGIDEWVAAKLPTQSGPSARTVAVYVPVIQADLLATYDYVRSGGAQIIDARPLESFGTGSVPGARNIPYEEVLDGGRMKDASSLEGVFTGLSRDEPVVVYTDTGIKASAVWFALDMLGYDARLYTWRDWISNQPSLNVDLLDVRADPNPARTGDAVRITAVFGEEGASAASSEQASIAPAGNAAISNETILTVKGCVTCGSQGFLGSAGTTKSGGIVKLGSSGQAAGQTEAFSAGALISGPDGSDVSSVRMTRVQEDEFSGIWNANVPAGVYTVTVTATSQGVTETFDDVLAVVVQ